MTIRARVVHGPIEPTARSAIDAWNVQPRAGPLSFLIPIARDREVFVLDPFVFSKGPLRAQHAPGDERGQDHEQRYAHLQKYLIAARSRLKWWSEKSFGSFF